MREFKLSPHHLRRVQRHILSFTLPLVLITVSVGLWMSVAASESTKGILPVIPIALVLMGIGVYRGYRREAQLGASFRLRVTDDEMTREVLGVPSITITRSQITRIERQPSGQLTIHAIEPTIALGIPPDLDDYTSFAAHLEAWHPITPVPSKQFTAFARTAAAGIVVLTLMAVTLVSRQPILVTVSGITLIAILVACILLARNHQMIDVKIRKTMLLVVFPILTIVVRIYFIWVDPKSLEPIKPNDLKDSEPGTEERAIPVAK